MIRPRSTWLLFLLCLTVVSAAMGWITLTALRLERAEIHANRQSENERLALWRMESALVPLISRESSRSRLDYRAFHRAEHAYSKLFAPIKAGEVQIPSALLMHDSPYVVLHFEYEPGGQITSPQVPTSNMRDLAEAKYTSHQRIEMYSDRLDRFRRRVSQNELIGALSRLETWNDVAIVQVQPSAEGLQTDVLPPNAPEVASQPNAPAAQSQGSSQIANPFQQQLVQQARTQQSRSLSEFQRRNLANASNTIQSLDSFMKGPAETSSVKQGAMNAVWLDGQLLLARRTVVEETQSIQGCLLDWKRIQSWLATEISDLLPEARLVPAEFVTAAVQPLMLASLPVKLIPGSAPVEPIPTLTPLRFSLLIAWLGVVLAAAAVAALLLAAIRLGERRGAFVSAVTHELRTPLTTFRLYTEMLADGIVPSEEKRQQYLETLRVEANRLGHLVENVLSYSRLEGSSAPITREHVVLNEMLVRLADSLNKRVERAEMILDVQLPDELPVVVEADAAAIERIIFNLVDNACKYASRASDRHIRVVCRRNGSRAEIRVRDHGGGISRKEAKRLFRPFSKSADEAAQSAPGVGLGLALCRRLARSMGGDLRIDHTVEQGACFVLTLPLHR